MKKYTVIKHNGKSTRIAEFTFDGKIASGYIRGRFITGNVGSYVYVVKGKGSGLVTADSNAKHYLIDLHNTTYEDRPLTRHESAKLSFSRTLVRNTHVKNLGNGKCEATGEVNGETITIEYNGYAEKLPDGSEREAKPWLGKVREDLLEKYNTKVQLDDVIRQLTVLRGKSEKEVNEAVRKWLIA